MEEENVVQIYSKGFEEGKKHTYSSETVRINDVIKVEFDGIASEWTYFKDLLVKGVLAIIVAIASYGIWVGAIQTTVAAHDKDIDEMRTEVRSAIISNAEIKTEVKSINSSLVRIEKAMGISQ